MLVDPPSGWRYGFPKKLPDDVTDIPKWLVEKGYPQSLIDAHGDYFYCRYIFDDPEELARIVVEDVDKERGRI